MFRGHGAKATLLLIPLLCLLVAEVGHGQDPAASRQKLVAAVEARAAKDVELDRPLAPSDLAMLFDEDAKAANVPPAELLSLYEAAYQKARENRSLWEKLKPGSGWIFGLTAAFLAILWTFFQKGIERFFEWLGKGLYSFVARFRPFWWLALRKYRQALVRTYQELKIPFRPGRPLSMAEVFVPLKVNEAGSTELVDAQTALSKHRRLVVVGDPGAGKTMLMRHLALAFAREGLQDFPGQPVPILVELHRLNGPGQDLVPHLTLALEQMGFPNAAGFVSSGLEKGNLLLLFDGLDEVNRDSRNRVVSQIKDLTQKAPGCQAVVTCRIAVYNNELAGWTDQNLKVVEFDDQQIQRFLSGWAKEMPPDKPEKSVEHLLTTLNERPRILALARNPLLLTIIAYLYCDTAFVLPHSRAEFYKNSTHLLLEQWDQFHQRGRNQYRASHKQLVLQALALFFQERAGQVQQDRRSAPLADVLRVIKEVLPTLNLDVQDAEPMLDEILDRSGLVLAIDGRTRFQFSHLTLQEFFAAMELETRADELLKLLGKDPDTWRETAKLWCGLDHDSTAFLREVERLDPLMALECLGDTQKVDADYATALIASFRVRLGNEGDDAEAVRRALALVAADIRPRGEQLRKELIASLADSATPQDIRQAAAQVLSHTNLPQAAEALAASAVLDPSIRKHLHNLGDLVVGALANWAAKNAEQGGWAIELLTAIGTPKAAKALAELLWNGERKVECQAAWQLSTLLPRREVEAALRSLALRPEWREDRTFDWLWEPFEPDPASALRVVARRIAVIMADTAKNEIPAVTLAVDTRLATPFCTVVAEEAHLKAIEPDSRKKTALEFRQELDRIASSDALSLERELSYFSDLFPIHPLWQYLLGTLNLKQRLKVIQLLCEEATPRACRDDWSQLYRPVSYRLDRSAEANVLRLLYLVLSLLGLLGLNREIVDFRGAALSWPTVAVFGFFALLPVILATASLRAKKIEDFEIASLMLFLFGLPSAALPLLLLCGSTSWPIGLALGGSLGGVLGILSHRAGNRFPVVAGMVSCLTFGGLVCGFGSQLAPSRLLLTLQGGVTVVVICASSAVLLLGLLILAIIFDDEKSNISVSLNIEISIFITVTASCAILPIVYFPSRLVHGALGWVGFLMFWLVWLLAVIGFFKAAVRKERQSQNRLHGLLGDEYKPNAAILARRGSWNLRALMHFFRTKTNSTA